MPIKWSALEVAEAIDQIEGFLNQAEPFLAKAVERAEQAQEIAYLPEYLGQRLRSMTDKMRARVNLRESIHKMREKIPQGAVEAERNAGRSLRLGLEIKPCRVRQHDDFMEALNRGLPLSHRHYWHIREEAEDAEQIEMRQL